MGYPGPKSTAFKAIAKDSFIEALDSELAQKMRERDPSMLDEALLTAVRLETIREAVPAFDVRDDTVRYKNKHARGIITGAEQSAIISVLAKMHEMQSRLDKNLKSINNRIANVESAVRRPHQSDVRNPPGRAWTLANPEHGSMPSAPEVSSQNCTVVSHPRLLKHPVFLHSVLVIIVPAMLVIFTVIVCKQSVVVILVLLIIVSVSMQMQIEIMLLITIILFMMRMLVLLR